MVVKAPTVAIEAVTLSVGKSLANLARSRLDTVLRWGLAPQKLLSASDELPQTVHWSEKFGLITLDRRIL